jgi:hypothetical protein
MKTKVFLFGMMLIGFSLTACSANDAVESLDSDIELVVDASDASLMSVPAFTTLPESLTQADIDGLMLMREEEGLAKDVYLYFYEKYKYRIFLNISRSETVHAAAVLRLIQYFELPDPATGKVGEYTNSHISDLYRTLTAQGTTIEKALEAGAFIEEYDIKDLQLLIAGTENEDIKRVYGNLMRGSGFHLRAFTSMLKMKGIIYEPKILTPEEYASIIKK